MNKSKKFSLWVESFESDNQMDKSKIFEDETNSFNVQLVHKEDAQENDWLNMDRHMQRREDRKRMETNKHRVPHLSLGVN